jgi:hypothetical protein
MTTMKTQEIVFENSKMATQVELSAADSDVIVYISTHFYSLRESFSLLVRGF